MITDNIVTEIGDELNIKGNVPILGLISLTSYEDTVIGETVDRYFDRKFRYSIDGINYSDYITLTDGALLSIEVNPKDTFYVEYLYKRSGTDTTGELELTDISLFGNYVDFQCGETFTKSIFYEYINCPDEEVLGWCINVSNKLYKNIVPKFITRNETQSTKEDRDFIDFWRTISCYFAVIVIYGRRILERFQDYTEIYLQYLRQKNYIVRDSEEKEDLNYLKSNYFNEIRKRGTIQIIKPKTETTPIDGELLRLIEYLPSDEFIFNLNKVENVGWNLGNSSPCYKGLTHIHNVIKGYEETQNVLDLSKYPLLESSYISLFTDGTKEVMKIENVSEGVKSGIGGITLPIPVITTLDYEITFYIKQPIQEQNITFEVKGYDENGVEQNFYNIFTETITNTFFKNQQLNRNDKYYFVRGVIYNRMKNKNSYGDSLLNIGVGNNLRFSSNITSIVPQLYITGGVESSTSTSTSTSTSNGVYIWDFKIRPLRTGYSKGFIQVNNFIELWLKNRNQNYDLTDIQTIIEKYLIPYNTNLKLIDLDEINSQDSSISQSASSSTSISTSTSTSTSTSMSTSQSTITDEVDLYKTYYENCCKITQIP